MKRTRKDRMKRILALTLSLVMLLALAACGGGEEKPEEKEPPVEEKEPETPEEPKEPEKPEPAYKVSYDDEEIYFNNFSDFYDAYQVAMEAKNTSERHALLAVAEAKFLETGGGTPTVAPTAGYTMTRAAFRSGGYAAWRGNMIDYAQYILTKEPITVEDDNALRELWKKCVGTGTYAEEATKYLESKGYTWHDTVTDRFFGNPTTWNIFASAGYNDWTLVDPALDYLYVYNAEGDLIPHLATSYEASEDGMTYTVKIREGMNWVDSQGRKVAEVVADDWVAAAQHQADLNRVWTMGPYIEGMQAYVTGENTDFNAVGVHALDKYTLEYKLTKPAPYFHTMFMGREFLPLCRSYFLSQGGAFGAAEYAEASASTGYKYGTSPDNIVYCGRYLCTNMTEKNSCNYILNPNRWDVDEAKIDYVNFTFDDLSDVSRAYNEFMEGRRVSTPMNTAQLARARETGDFEKYVIQPNTGRSTNLTWLNLHRQTYANVADGAAPSKKTDLEKEISVAAMQNKNFRLAMAHSIDRAANNAQSLGEDLKYVSIRNTMTPGDFVAMAEDVTIDINGTPTTFPKGTWYGEIVQAQFDADGFPVQAWDPEKETTDGWDAWFNPELAREYLDKACEEMATLGYEISAENPIVVDSPYVDFNEIDKNAAYVMMRCYVDTLGDRLRFDMIPLHNNSELMNVQNTVKNASERNADIASMGPIGSQYGDPQCYLEGLMPYGDGNLTMRLGLW